MRKQAASTFVALVVLAAFLSFGLSARAADGAAPSYPDWAAAVVPAYPRALPSSGPVTPTLYGIATTTACRRWWRGTSRACTAHGREAREEIPGL